MSTQPNIKPLPDFKHRIEGDIGDALGLTNTIDMMASRAKGILNLLIINQENGGMLPDDVVVAGIAAAIAEINDMDATVQAFHQATVDAESQFSGGAQ